MRVRYCRSTSLRVATERDGWSRMTKPPLEPAGTITEFLTIWVSASPSTSVRKSSGRSL